MFELPTTDKHVLIERFYPEGGRTVYFLCTVRPYKGIGITLTENVAGTKTQCLEYAKENGIQAKEYRFIYPDWPSNIKWYYSL